MVTRKDLRLPSVNTVPPSHRPVRVTTVVKAFGRNAPSWHTKGWNKHTTHECEQRQLPSAQLQLTAKWTPLIFCWNLISKWKLTVPRSTLYTFHHSVSEWKRSETDFFPTHHVTARKFYYFIRHIHLQWESKHRQEFCQVVQRYNFIYPTSWNSRITRSVPQAEQPPSQRAFFI